MTDSHKDLRMQRDRYIAFALAAADLCIEADAVDRIAETTGATHSLLGRDSVAGCDIFDIFAEADRPFVRRLLARARKQGRIAPTVVRLGAPHGDPVRVMVGACHLSWGERLYVTVTALSQALAGQIPDTDPVSGLAPADAFETLAAAALQSGDTADGAAEEMRLIRLEGLSRVLSDLPVVQANAIMSELGALLRDQSVGGTLAGQVGHEDFAIVSSGRQANDRRLDDGLRDVLEMAGAADAVQPNVVNIRIDAGMLDGASTSKAIAYALQTFEKTGGVGFRSLQEGLSEAVKATVGRATQVKDIIAGGKFDLIFQPVVGLADRDIHHHEALMRFADGKSPYETVVFSEHLGLVSDLDLAACRRAAGVLRRAEGQSVAVNISGQSLGSDIFRQSLMAVLAGERNLAGRLLFEITESSAIADTDSAANFLTAVRSRGFQLCLDDFGAGAAGYNYLRAFEVDFVKIDGPFLQAALTDIRQRALIRSVGVLCEDLGCAMIGEMIETEAQRQFAIDAGIAFGQGYLFGKPARELLSARPVPVAARRKGAVESWG